MISPWIVWGLAGAEMRQCRRLVRFWVFEIIAALIGLAVYSYYMAVHWNVSAVSASASILNPRFLIRFLGIYYLYFGFLFGLIFLGFDVRARETQERIDEVVDSLPCSNLEWLLGRYLGIAFATWLPLVVIVGVLLLVGLPFKESLEPGSLLTFLVPMAVPGSCFVLGLTFFVTLIVRHRLIAAFLLVALLVGLIVANFTLVPIYLLPLTDLSGGFSVPDTSDIIPKQIDLHSFEQRIGVLLAGLALLLFSAAIYPREDDSSRRLTALAGLLLMAGAAALCGTQVAQARATLGQRESWRAVHAAREADPAPDLLELSGQIKIDPGRGLDGDLTLRFKARVGETLQTALFTLNPGLHVRQVRRPHGGDFLPFESRDGLLAIALDRPLTGEDEMSVEVAMAGVPDAAFAYLDSVFEPLTRSVTDSRIFLLGYQPMIFDRRFVALLPGIGWLPASGALGVARPATAALPAEAGRSAVARPADFFRIDLTVDLPAGWLAAGPGRREVVPGAESGVRFRFAPPAPVPQVALIAGRFASVATQIGEVTLEALVHPSHAGNLEFFADAGGELKSFLAVRLEEAAGMGLAYPYGALTLVEVPSSLRGYAGGWRMDSSLIQPAMILTREAGFPTARFDTRFRDPKKFEDRAGGLPRAKRDALIRFFENDFSGGNPFLAASRNFFGFQTAAEGAEAPALDFVCETLATRLITGREGYFSLYHMGADANRTVGRVMSGLFNAEHADEDLSRVMIEAVTARSEVWDAVLGKSLADLDPWDDSARALDVLTLKGGALSDSLLDGLGRDKSGRLLAALRNRYAGGSFRRADMIAAGRDLGLDLETLLATWIDATGLPGFTLGAVQGWRLPDRNGSPRYQLLVAVRNEEPTPGLVRLEYTVGDAHGAGSGRTEPIRLAGTSAVQIGLVTSAFPQIVRVVPYLALNRAPFNVPLPDLDEDRIVREEPFNGWRPMAWQPDDAGTIVVDDLDPGFQVKQEGHPSGWRLGARGRVGEMDEGLPVAIAGVPATEWSRVTFPDAYGKYRHTMAVVRPGHGDQIASFTAAIPSSGQWELEYQLPRPENDRARARRGTWHLTVIDGAGQQALPFDADGGEPGWNRVQALELAAGPVEVRVSDATNGDLVMADAIRWMPASR